MTAIICLKKVFTVVSVEENQTILHELEENTNSSTMVTTAVKSKPEVAASPSTKEASFKRRKPVFNRAFSFDIKNLLPGGGDLSIRRFSITEAALLLIMGYLASRGLGVIRQTIFNALFGTGPEANAYYAAARLPDTLFDLIAGGALAHAFIPVFLSYDKEHGQREAWRLASLVFNVLLVLLTFLVLISEFLAPTFVNKFLVPGYSPSEQALTTTLTRILLVQPLILGLGTVATAILSSKRQFLLPALSIAVYNVGLIGGLLFSLAIPGVGIYGPTYGILVAAVCQVTVMIPALVKQKVRYTFIWNLRHPGLREVMRLLGPNTLSIAIASIALILDTAFISFLPDRTSLAAVRNAHLLLSLPVTLIGQAIGQASLPQMAVQASAGRYIRLRNTVLKLMGGALLLSIIAALLLYLLGKPTIHLLFQHGAFTKHSSNVTNNALIGYAFALPGLASIALLSLGFYALKDAITPLFTDIVGLLVHGGLIVLLLKLLAGPHAVLAIPLATTGSATVEALLLFCLLFIRLRTKVKLDKGMQRLLRRRNAATIVNAPITILVEQPDADLEAETMPRLKLVTKKVENPGESEERTI